MKTSVGIYLHAHVVTEYDTRSRLSVGSRSKIAEDSSILLSFDNDSGDVE